MIYMNRNRLLLLLLVLAITLRLTAEEKKDTTSFRKEGFTFGVLPVVAYDNDLGFQYGVLTNLYWYGDGSEYPKYDHSLYLECSRYVAGTMLLRTYLDSRKLLPGLRTTIDFTWFNDLTMDFTGFNGRESLYHREWEDEDSEEYRTSIYYRHSRRMARLMAGVRKDIENTPFYWQAGLTLFNMKIGTVDKSKLKSDVPQDATTLYEQYCKWNVLRENERRGGVDGFLRAGIGIDTRQGEAFSTGGIWSELLLSVAPRFFSNHDNHWVKLTIYHRQYFDLYKEKLVLAYRLGVQHRLSGRQPFYLLPHWVTNTLGSATSQGLGGAKTMRGLVRNRIVADGTAMGNIELRWVPIRFQWLKQHWSLGFNAFSDLGITTQGYDVNFEDVPKDMIESHFDFSSSNDKLHASTGLGVKIGMNSNFVVSADWGKALDANDGASGFYVQMNWLF